MMEIQKKNKTFLLFFVCMSLVFLLSCDGIGPSTPVIHSFSANPPMINESESSTLTWHVTDADSVIIDHGVGAVSLTGTIAVTPEISTTYTLTVTNSAGGVTKTTTITVTPMPTLTIFQTEGTAKTWFGASHGYVNVGQGQSFQVTEAGFFDQFQIYLSSPAIGTNATDSGDIIVCDLRDSTGNILQSDTINGFVPGTEGWQEFNFNSLTYIMPGTYYCTCYVSNPIAEHVYYIHCNIDSNSYPGGTCYNSTGGHPEDWSSWFTWSSPSEWDLQFKVIIKLVLNLHITSDV